VKKDYMPISDAAVTDDEATFVADYWTKHWEGSDIQSGYDSWVESQE
jgi:hypothetical protein